MQFIIDSVHETLDFGDPRISACGCGYGDELSYYKYGDCEQRIFGGSSFIHVNEGFLCELEIC